MESKARNHMACTPLCGAHQANLQHARGHEVKLRQTGAWAAKVVLLRKRRIGHPVHHGLLGRAACAGTATLTPFRHGLEKPLPVALLKSTALHDHLHQARALRHVADLESLDALHPGSALLLLDLREGLLRHQLSRSSKVLSSRLKPLDGVLEAHLRNYRATVVQNGLYVNTTCKACKHMHMECSDSNDPRTQERPK